MMEFLNIALIMLIAATGSGEDEVDYDPYGLVSYVYYDDVPPPMFLAESQHITKKKGELVSFNCSIVADKENLNTQYRLSVMIIATENYTNKLLFDDEDKIFVDIRMELNNGIFVMSNVQHSDAGRYMCFYGSNPLEPISELIHTLEIQYSPRVVSPTKPPLSKTTLPIIGKLKGATVQQTTASGSSSKSFSMLLLLAATLLLRT